MKDKKMKEYFSSKNITNEDTLFVKAGEIDVLLAICAYKFSDKSLADELAESWQQIINAEVSDEDVKFVKSHDWKEGGYPITLFNNIKTKKFVGASDEQKKEYLRKIWFFMFMAKNYIKPERKKLGECVEKRVQPDRGGRYRGAKKSVLSILNRIYNGMTVSDKQYQMFWRRIEKSYLTELEKIFEQAKKILLDNGTGKFSHFFELLSSGRVDSKSSSVSKKAIVSEKASRAQEVKVNESGDNSKEEIAESNENITVTKQPPTAIEKEKFPKGTMMHQEQTVANNLLQANVVATKATAQTEEKVIRLIKHQEVLTKREDYFSMFEENISKIYELSGKLSEEGMYRGMEELITTLNSPVYDYLLDRLFLATQNKEKVSNDFYSVACLIKNALEEKNFVFEFYPNEPLGTCIGASSESDREYIGRNYRFKGQNLLYKNLYIAAPGIKNRKTKLFVCLPLVEVK